MAPFTERDVVDGLLVVVLAAVTYVEQFGLSAQLASVSALVRALSEVQFGVYLVTAAVFGVFFVGYLTVVQPRRDANRTARETRK